MDSPARGDCSGQKAWIWDSKNGFPRQGRLLPDKKLGFGTSKMDSPGRGACSGHKNLDLGLQKWIPPVGAPASAHKNMYWERPVANLGYPWFLDTFPVFKNFLAPVAFQDPWFLVEVSCGTTCTVLSAPCTSSHACLWRDATTAATWHTLAWLCFDGASLRGGSSDGASHLSPSPPRQMDPKWAQTYPNNPKYTQMDSK